MFEEIIEHTKKFKELNISVFSIFVLLNTEISKKNIFSIFERTRKIFPELTEFNNDDENVFRLSSKEKSIENIIRLWAYKNQKKMGLSWGNLVDSEITSEKILDISKCIQDELEFNSFAISNIELQFMIFANTKVNNLKILHNTFYNSNIYNSIIDANNVTQNSINLVAFLDVDRMIAMNLDSNLSMKEIEEKNFNDSILSTRLGIAKIRGFLDEDLDLFNRIMENNSFGKKFIIEKYIPYVLAPLDANLFKEKTEVSQ